MIGRFLVGSKDPVVEGNIYADKSALILNWLLHMGSKKKGFSLRQVATEAGVSVGLVQKVFETLVMMGLLQTEGVRTAKCFYFKKSQQLLTEWLDHYSIVKKCKMWTYRTGFQDKNELFGHLREKKIDKKVALALHTAAEAYNCKTSNLQTLELYLLDSSIRKDLEKTLLLEHQERGYEVLLIEPYYKSWLKQNKTPSKSIAVSPVLLTFLDLYHFPLRGREQAEFMAQRLSELKSIFKAS